MTSRSNLRPHRPGTVRAGIPKRCSDACSQEGTPQRYGDWMQTFTGIQFWPLDPRSDEVCIEDIVHSLANQCRFAGHCTAFYSVAQHSVLVSQIVPPADAMWGLLHDAPEAYLVDLPRPVKRHSDLGSHYRQIEQRLAVVICDYFGLPSAEPESVKMADDILLMTEKRDLMPNSPAKWREVSEPLEAPIVPMLPAAAKRFFMDRYRELTRG